MVTLGSLLTTAAELTKPNRDQEQRTVLQNALKDVRAAVAGLLPNHAVRHSEGQTIPSDIPWVVIFPKGRDDTNTTTGYYAVYLFAWDGKFVNLCFGLGTDKVKSLAALRARTTALSEFCPNTADLARVPELTKETGRAADYINGTVVAKVYKPEQMPTEVELQSDLDRFVGFADTAYENGVRFHASMEPIHLVYPWAHDLSAPGTLTSRKAIADELGATWWTTNTSVAPERVDQLREQIAQGIPTYGYLCAPGDSWRTRLMDITTSVSDIEAEPKLVAPGVTPHDGKLATST